MDMVATYQASIAAILERHAAYWKSARGLARELVELDKRMIAAIDAKDLKTLQTLEQRHDALIDAITDNNDEGPTCPQTNAQLQAAVHEALTNSGIDPAIPSPDLDLFLAQLQDATQIEFKQRRGRLADCVRDPIVGGPTVEERPGRIRIGVAPGSPTATSFASAAPTGSFFDVDMILDTGARPFQSTGAPDDEGTGKTGGAGLVPDSPILVLSEALFMLRSQTDDIAASAFDAYADAMVSAVDSGHFSAAGLGKAMRASTKQSLLSIGQQASSKGAFEVAEAIGSSADGEGAGKHIAAAGKWFLVAGLAGAGAAAVGGGEGGGGSKDRKRDEVAPNGADSEGRDASKGRVIQHIRVVGNPTDVQVGEIKGRLASGARGRTH